MKRSLEKAFDRAWARAPFREAATDERAKRRLESLRPRFQEGLLTCDIAEKWLVEAAKRPHD